MVAQAKGKDRFLAVLLELFLQWWVVDQPTRNQKVKMDFGPKKKDICLSPRGLGETFLI